MCQQQQQHRWGDTLMIVVEKTPLTPLTRHNEQLP
jgi:hypothetical protein